MLQRKQIEYVNRIFSEALEISISFRSAIDTAEFTPKENECWIVGHITGNMARLSLEGQYSHPINICAFQAFVVKLNEPFQVILTFEDGTPAIIQLTQRTNIFLFFFDVLSVSFEIISLQDDPHQRDLHGRVLAKYYENSERWKIPFLDHLWGLLKKNLVSVKQKTESPIYGILMTHDIDRIQLEPVQCIKNLLKRDLAGFKVDIKEAIKNMYHYEREHGVRALSFFLSGSYSIRRYGNRYGRRWKSFQESLQRVDGLPIGLHTSYYSSYNAKCVAQEVQWLQEKSRKEIIANRNHYLRFDFRKSWSIYEESGIKLDSTVGFSDENGFRSGLCHLYRPWNYEANRLSSIWEIPLLYMDCVKSKPEDAWNDIMRILDNIKKFKGCGAVLFHPCGIAQSPENMKLFKEFVCAVQKKSIPFIDPSMLFETIRESDRDFYLL